MPRSTKAENRAARLSHTIVDIARATDDFTLRQMSLLLALRARTTNDATVRGMAAEFGLSKPVITRAMDRLVDQNLAVRLPDPADGRSILMVITPHGVAMADTIATRLS